MSNIQYCKNCGSMLQWVENEVTLEQIGWKCPTCNVQWSTNNHEKDMVALIKKVKELETENESLQNRLTKIEKILSEKIGV